MAVAVRDSIQRVCKFTHLNASTCTSPVLCLFCQWVSKDILRHREFISESLVETYSSMCGMEKSNTQRLAMYKVIYSQSEMAWSLIVYFNHVSGNKSYVVLDGLVSWCFIESYNRCTHARSGIKYCSFTSLWSQALLSCSNLPAASNSMSTIKEVTWQVELFNSIIKYFTQFWNEQFIALKSNKHNRSIDIREYYDISTAFVSHCGIKRLMEDVTDSVLDLLQPEKSAGKYYCSWFL